MSGFRVLGIKTKNREKNKNDSEVNDYLKVLKENTYYPFYSNYKLSKDGNILTCKTGDEIDLYSIKKNDLKINISAIVGKNGSGKSTLLELLYLASYNLGCNYGLLREWIPDKEKKFDHNCKPIIEGKHINCKSLNLNLDIIFDKKNKFYSLRFRGKSIELLKGFKTTGGKIKFDNNNVLKNENKNELSLLFYSIATNYSIFGLNSEILGNWIKPLFHKNDGYKTPLVISPMRSKGKFDINDEMEFASQRLLHNLLIEKQNKKQNSKIFVTDKQFVKSVRFKFNKKNKLSQEIKTTNAYGISGVSQSVNLIIDLQKTFFGDNFIEEVMLYREEIPFQLEISNYLVRKIRKISYTYEEYNMGYSSSGDNKLFLERLSKDESHITFKLKQAIHFLRVSIGKTKEENIWYSLKSKQEYIDLTLNEILDWMNCRKGDVIITKIPPSIFSFEIILSKNKKQFFNVNREPTFNDLSSGEQQMIHSIQSVIYHLYNLQSVHKSNDKRLAYSDVNIIFDEIELYFHPEYQRSFISKLLKSIERVGIGKRGDISALNFIFSTHSPFILSDIPKTNILRLKNGIPKFFGDEEETFASNINELLARGFFMETLIGKFADEKIMELIRAISKKKYTEKEQKLIDLIGDSYLKASIKQFRNQTND